VYYAHLISNRGKCQSQDEFVDSDEGSGDSPLNQADAPKKLIPMAKNENGNHLQMWFV
jgi:eukaryotic translation initiation factor 2C